MLPSLALPLSGFHFILWFLFLIFYLYSTCVSYPSNEFLLSVPKEYPNPLQLRSSTSEDKSGNSGVLECATSCRIENILELIVISGTYTHFINFPAYWKRSSTFYYYPLSSNNDFFAPNKCRWRTTPQRGRPACPAFRRAYFTLHDRFTCSYHGLLFLFSFSFSPTT
jgi:hypothetical protein